MHFNWNSDKNEELKKERGISFEQIVIAIEEKKVVDVLEHPNENKYFNQILILVNINDYIFVVPTVIDDTKKEYFFKTIYPSRKYSTKYLEGK